MVPGPTPGPASAWVAVLHVNAACLVWGSDVALPHCLSPLVKIKIFMPTPFIVCVGVFFCLFWAVLFVF